MICEGKAARTTGSGCRGRTQAAGGPRRTGGHAPNIHSRTLINAELTAASYHTGSRAALFLLKISIMFHVRPGFHMQAHIRYKSVSCRTCSLGSTCNHTFATHFSPASTGHAECWAQGSHLPAGLKFTAGSLPSACIRMCVPTRQKVALLAHLACVPYDQP